MEISALHKNARMSPQKLRPLSRILRGMDVRAAQHQLQYMPGKAPQLIAAVLKSATANATHNYNLQLENLMVRSVLINPGLVMKRFMPVSRGMAHGILKRSSNITVVVAEREKTSEKLVARTSDIEEMTAQEFAERGLHDTHEDHDHVAEGGTDDAKAKEVETLPIEKKQGKAYEATQRIKGAQQGGDAKQTHRRKSMGSGK